MSKEFKTWDKVYYPMHDTKVHIVEQRDDDGDLYPLRVCGVVFSTSGTTLFSKTTPLIFHANEENHELLEKLYDVEFEKPPAKPTSKDIVQVMLERGDKYVPCWVHDLFGEEQFVLITEKETTGWYIDGVGNAWATAQPIDPITGELLTELPQ